MEFLKASIADLITLLFSSLQNSEGGGDCDSGDSCIPVETCLSGDALLKGGGGENPWSSSSIVD